MRSGVNGLKGRGREHQHRVKSLLQGLASERPAGARRAAGKSRGWSARGGPPAGARRPGRAQAQPAGCFGARAEPSLSVGPKSRGPPQSHPQSPAPGSPAGPLRSLPSPGPALWTSIPNLLSSSISRYLNYANLPPPYGPLPTLFFKVKGAQGFPDARTFARPSTFQSCPSGAQISPTTSTLPLSPLLLTNPKATPSG